MAQYLVTGGAGFIGSHVVTRLLEEGHRARVLDDFSNGTRANLAHLGASPAGLEVIEGDICDPAACAGAMRGAEFVIHLAAMRSVPRSMNEPHDYNRVNIDGTLNIYEAARDARVTRVAVASSSSVYGEAVSFPEKETDPTPLISPYALTKLAGEYYGRIFTLNFGLPVVNLRYFNVYGERQSLEDDYAVVVPKFISCLLRGEAPPIYGDGSQARDFTHVENVVNATLAAVRAPEAAGLVINVACGREQSVLELVETLNRLMGLDIKPVFGPARPGDVPRTLADISLARKVLGYEPRVDFEEGLRRAIEYFRSLFAS